MSKSDFTVYQYWTYVSQNSKTHRSTISLRLVGKINEMQKNVGGELRILVIRDSCVEQNVVIVQ